MLGLIRRSVRRRPGVCLMLLVVGGAVLWFTFLPADASVTSDDGAYALHVRALEHGGWSVPHVLAEVDSEGATYPYQNARISDDGFFPAPRHAVWVRVLEVGSQIAGIPGMRALPALGLAVAALAAVAMADVVHGPGRSWIAGVLTVASPLLFNALQLWAHAAVAGAIAIAMLGALHLANEPSRWRWLVVVVVAASAASAMRADGLIFGVATGAVLGLYGLQRRHALMAAAGAAVGVASVLAFMGAGRYAQSIVGGSSDVGFASNRASGSLSGRMRGVMNTFFTAPDPPLSLVLVVIAFALVGYAVVKLRSGRTTEASVLLAASSLLWVVRTVLLPDEMTSGLLGAWPLLLLAFVRTREDIRPGEWQLLAIVSLAALGVAATQYDEGGGLNWGGRFLAPAIPALAVVLAGAFGQLTADRERRRAVPMAGALVGTCILGMLTFDVTIRTRHHDFVEGIRKADAPVVTSSVPLPRLAWSTYPDVQWLRVPVDRDGKEDPYRLLELLRLGDIEHVVLYGVGDDVAELFDQPVGTRRDGQVTVVRVPPSSSET